MITSKWSSVSWGTAGVTLSRFCGAEERYGLTTSVKCSSRGKAGEILFLLVLNTRLSWQDYKARINGSTSEWKNEIILVGIWNGLKCWRWEHRWSSHLSFRWLAQSVSRNMRKAWDFESSRWEDWQRLWEVGLHTCIFCVLVCTLYFKLNNCYAHLHDVEMGECAITGAQLDSVCVSLVIPWAVHANI